jgi:hypothetical protein
MVRTIVDNVATLAQALEITQAVIGWVMIEVRCSQDDAGSPHLRRLFEIRPARRPASPIAPGMTRAVEPPSVGQTANSHSMRPPASLANSCGPLEPHTTANL